MFICYHNLAPHAMRGSEVGGQKGNKWAETKLI
jgi:hypothetical protein